MNAGRQSSYAYGSRSRGLTGNQLKLIGIAAVLIDNLGAVVIQGVILQGGGPEAYQAAAADGHVWVIAGQACRYVGRLGFPILGFLTAEEFVRARDRQAYGIRMLAAALISEVPFDLAVYGRVFYPQYQNMLFTMFIGILVIAVMEETRQTSLRAAALAGGCVLSWVGQCDYNILGVLFITAMYRFRRNDLARLGSGIGLCAAESASCYCVSALAFVPIVMYNGTRGALQYKYLLSVFYPLHLLILYGIRRAAG